MTALIVYIRIGFLLALQIAAVTLAIAIVAFAIAQSWLVHRYCWCLNQSRQMSEGSEGSERESDDEAPFLPAAAVVVCLRGDDPSLYECLLGLAQQEYPEFQLYGVVDNENDPAIETFESARTAFDCQPILVTIPEIAKHRSLKCSALLAAFEVIKQNQFDPEVVALLDSDVNCDPYWLADLVAPFQNSEVGATTGNRWFEPESNEIGTWMRQIWNAAAVVQMYHYNIAWGGSLAFRATLIDQEKFLAPLRIGFCEDTRMNRVLAKFDLELVRVPGLIMSSTESTTPGKCFSFIARQLLTTKLYHRAWPLVAFHGLLIPFFIFAAIVIPFCASDSQVTLFHLLPLFALVLLQALNLFLLERIARANHLCLSERDQPIGKSVSLVHYLLAVILIQFVHAFAVLAAIFKRVYSWRQIDYHIKGNDVSMLQYQPFVSPVSDDGSIE